MEGKAVLFKRFADVDSIDLEVDTEDPEEFINAVKFLGPSFGGINLEDIKAPECFIIEERLRELMDIPVFHDDQHGTAIIAAAGMINAMQLTGRDIKQTRLVCNGAGRGGHRLPRSDQGDGLRARQRHALRHQGRRLSRPRGRHEPVEIGARRRDAARTLADAMAGADIFFGLSAKGALTAEMVKSMAPNPIIFAMANPDPEITPEEAHAARDDVIIATGRSDYPNQVNNVLGFPYIFRGALDVRAKTINMEMKIAAAHALAELAREDVPDEVAVAYRGARPRFGRDYIIPTPFDPRLIHVVPMAVAKAAMESGVARRPIVDMSGLQGAAFGAARPDRRRDAAHRRARAADAQARRRSPRARRSRSSAPPIPSSPRASARRFWSAARIACAAVAAQSSGFDLAEKGIEIHNARLSQRNTVYAQFLYERLQRRGFLFRDCQRMINQDRNYFAAAMVAHGDADAMVTGVTRNFSIALEEVRRVIDDKPGHRVIGVSLVLARGRPIVVADTAITEMPDAEDLAQIAVEAAGVARRLGYEPRVAMLAFSNFGHPPGERTQRVQEAVRILDSQAGRFRIRRRDGRRRRAEPRADGGLSVLPAHRHRQRAGDAGVPFGLDLDPHAAGARRRDGDRAADRRAGEAGADRPARRARTPTSSIWRRWRASISGGEGAAALV